MLKRSVIAADITNLTDARYFSSWGVDYLLFDLAHVAIDEVATILDWVDGVRPLLQINADSLGFLDEAMIKIKPHAIGSSDKDIFEGLLNLGLDCLLFFSFIQEKDMDQQKMIVLSEIECIDPKTLQISPSDLAQTFIAPPSDLESLKRTIESNSNLGLILEGGDELQVGMKNYDALDPLLEFLEESD